MTAVAAMAASVLAIPALGQAVQAGVESATEFRVQHDSRGGSPDAIHAPVDAESDHLCAVGT